MELSSGLLKRHSLGRDSMVRTEAGRGETE